MKPTGETEFRMGSDIERSEKRARHGPRRVVQRVVFGSSLLFNVLVPGARATAEDEEVVYAGVCSDMELEVVFPTAVDLDLTTTAVATAINFAGGADTCAVTQNGDPSVQGATLTGTTTTPATTPLTCAGGVAVGRGTFQLTGTGFPQAIEGEVVVIWTGAAATVDLVQAIPPGVELVGTGDFVQDPADTATCPSGLTATTWTGPFTFVATSGVSLPGGITGSGEPR